MTHITIVVVQTISLKLPEDLMSRLAGEADLRGVTRSQLIRDSLEAALFPATKESQASCYDLAHDLAGTVKGLPADLADNPKYMKGFGE